MKLLSADKNPARSDIRRRKYLSHSLKAFAALGLMAVGAPAHAAPLAKAEAARQLADDAAATGLTSRLHRQPQNLLPAAYQADPVGDLIDKIGREDQARAKARRVNMLAPQTRQDLRAGALGEALKLERPKGPSGRSGPKLTR